MAVDRQTFANRGAWLAKQSCEVRSPYETRSDWPTMGEHMPVVDVHPRLLNEVASLEDLLTPPDPRIVRRINIDGSRADIQYMTTLGKLSPENSGALLARVDRLGKLV